MHTQLKRTFSGFHETAAAEKALLSCVHCGFCNATCPTYQLTGDELEGPRGRIFLMKSWLQGEIDISTSFRNHLDSCLSCLACETTCPSGVRYRDLIEPMRHVIHVNHRPFWQRWERHGLHWLLTSPIRMRWAMWGGYLSKWVATPLLKQLPSKLRVMLELAEKPPKPPKEPSSETFGLSANGHGHAPAIHAAPPRMRIALLNGCAQQVVAPEINAATEGVFKKLGCEIITPSPIGCCGSLTYHMGLHAEAKALMRKSILSCQAESLVQGGKGLDMVVVNTSGCGVVMKDYAHIFADESDMAEPAAAMAPLVKDFSEAVALLGLPAHASLPTSLSIGFHDPCSLQHGQKSGNVSRDLLAAIGAEMKEIGEGHLCCGSAGTYHILNPDSAALLGQRKAAAIDKAGGQVVVTANVGCIKQIAQYSMLPVVHTAEIIYWSLGGPTPQALLTHPLLNHPPVHPLSDPFALAS